MNPIELYLLDPKRSALAAWLASRLGNIEVVDDHGLAGRCVAQTVDLGGADGGRFVLSLDEHHVRAALRGA